MLIHNDSIIDPNKIYYACQVLMAGGYGQKIYRNLRPTAVRIVEYKEPRRWEKYYIVIDATSKSIGDFREPNLGVYTEYSECAERYNSSIRSAIKSLNEIVAAAEQKIEQYQGYIIAE